VPGAAPPLSGASITELLTAVAIREASVAACRTLAAATSATGTIPPPAVTSFVLSRIGEGTSLSGSVADRRRDSAPANHLAVTDLHSRRPLSAAGTLRYQPGAVRSSQHRPRDDRPIVDHPGMDALRQERLQDHRSAARV